MAKFQSSINKYNVLWLVFSMILNVLFIIRYLYDDVGGGGSEWNLSWSSRAAREAEAVAAISCSGHGRAYLDGLLLGNQPVCECNTCFSGPDCSLFLPDCDVNADGGDPLFLEPFWMEKAASSAIVVAGWHRMSYTYKNNTDISRELESHIRKLHGIVGNAVTEKRFIVFGAGSTQLLNAAVHALSPHNNHSSPARVVASIPYYPLYEAQTEFFQSVDYQFEGDTSEWKNRSDRGMEEIVEFVTAPNNPDGQMNKAVLKGPNAKAIHDHAYYWPHYTPITAPADENLMLFTTSKLTGHAGSRFGWAVIKDESVYQNMALYMNVNTKGVSRDTQLRVLKLLKVVLESGGREIFEFGHNTMRNRWEKLSSTISLSNRFSLQQIPPNYCTFFNNVRPSSPAFAWVKCEREEDINCYEVLKAAKIIGREGNIFQGQDRYVRLSLLRSQDDFDLLLYRLNKLVSEENGAKTM